MTVVEIKDYIAEQKLVIHSQKEDEVLSTESAVVTLDIIKDMLDELDNEWVDVRDRLPSEEEIKENNGMFEVTTYTLSCEECVEIKEFRNGKFIIGYAMVIGWRPLPKPYERKE